MTAGTDPTVGFQENSLIQQGYDYTPEELRELSRGLRFTPLVCMGIALIGLSLQEPLIHFGLAILGIVPFWFPSGHPVDWIYNHVLRPLWNGVVLPPNPLPRRIACLIGGTMNLCIGLFFVNGMNAWAYGFGAVMVTLQLVVIFTHFCLASWVYEIGMKWFGQWDPPISGETFKRAMAEGAILVDVRDPEEYARGHLKEAVNIPLDKLQEGLDDPAQTCVLYCQGGVRSQQGVRQLKRAGWTSVLNLGAIGQAPADWERVE